MRRMLVAALVCLIWVLPLAAAGEEHEDRTDVSLYGRLWPKITYTTPSDGDPSTDITDALSRLGVSANYRLTDTLSAVAQAEVRVNLGSDGSTDFFTEHLGYVGLQSSDLGLFAIGTQWNPYYNIVAAVTDVYYHRASPFGYDNLGPFREEQIVRYAHSYAGFNLDLGVQLKGQSTGAEDFDKVYAGVGYTYGPVYVGLGYLEHDMGTDRRNYVGLGASWSVIDDLYLAVTYQTVEYAVSPDANSLDVATTYSFGPGFTVIGGFFSYEDNSDTSGPHHIGYNLTLVKSLTGNVRLFAEWLRKDFQEGDHADETEDVLSLGLRISFDAQVL